MKLEKLIKLLEKRAKGFSYEEIQEEFVSEDDKSGKMETNDFESKKQKNLFDFDLENKGFGEHGEKIFGTEIGVLENTVVELPPKRKRGRPKKSEARNDGSKKLKGMTLVKRKVHTFFVPPDMTAIKMLIEYEGRPSEFDEDVVELAEKRRALLKEIKKELLGEDYYED